MAKHRATWLGVGAWVIAAWTAACGSLAIAQFDESAASAPSTASGDVDKARTTVSGIVRSLDHADVPAREAGQLITLDVRENAQVQAGQQIGQLDDEAAKLAYYLAAYEWEAAKMEAESDIEIRLSEKSRAVAQATLEDANEANDRSSSPIFTEAELRRRKFSVEQAQAQIEFSGFKQQQAAVTQKAKLAQLKRAQESLERHKIVAPIQGEVVELYKRVGEWVDIGQSVLRIVRMDKLQVEGHVTVSDWPRAQLIRREVEVVVNVPGGGTETFRGVITRIGSIVEGGEYMIWVEIDNRREGDTWVITPELDATIKL